MGEERRRHRRGQGWRRQAGLGKESMIIENLESQRKLEVQCDWRAEFKAGERR